MKNFAYNIGYFLKEVKTIFNSNWLSNFLSLFSIGLIFFIFAMIVSGWWASSQVVEMIRKEAEISVYFQESMGSAGAARLAESIKGIDGVNEVRVVSGEEAYSRMEEILGKEARVLEVLDENPFSAFIEVKIQLDKMDAVISGLNWMPGIEQVRDNREVLEKLRDISGMLSFIGTLVLAAVGITTLVIISHIIRMGIYANREQIKTLRLLGAPEGFIAFPFMLEGLLLTLGGGLLAAALSAFAINQVYIRMAGALPFIPLPPQGDLVAGLVLMLVLLSAALGAAGSLFGFSSSK